MSIHSIAEFLFADIFLASPNDQEEAVRIIRNHIAGGTTAVDTESLHSIRNRLMDSGAESVLLGCTELPLVAQVKKNTREQISSLHVLVESACDAAFEE